VLVDSGMAIAPPHRVREGNTSHMPDPLAIAGNRERRTDEDDASANTPSEPSESDGEDTSSSESEGESSSSREGEGEGSSSSADADADADADENNENTNDDKNTNKNETTDHDKNIDNNENKDDDDKNIDDEENNNITSTPTIQGHAVPVPSHVSVQPTSTPSRKPIQGGDAPTTILATHTPSLVHTSELLSSTLEQGSDVPTNALEHHGEGKLNCLYIFIFYLSSYVLVTPIIPHHGIYFILFICSYMNLTFLDVEMESPPPMGSSRSTGGILRGKAYGNVPNHADFPKLQFSTDIPQAGNPQILIKVFVYLVYNDPVSISVVPDPSVHPNVSFFVSVIPPLDCALVLKKIADRLEAVTCKLCDLLKLLSTNYSKRLIFFHNPIFLAHTCGICLVHILVFWNEMKVLNIILKMNVIFYV
jgi:hypothetical protein